VFGVIDLPAYLVGLVLIILLPGPNSMYVLSVAARLGVRKGYTAAAGVFTGDAVLMVLTAAGVASILKTNPVLFGIVKWAGAVYLAWLAIGMLRGAWSAWGARREVPLALALDALSAERASRERPYRRALVVSLLNPKAILFFVAFFVQFVDPSYARPWLSFLVLGAMCQVASMAYLSALIFSGTRLADSFRRRKRLSAAASASVGAAFLAFAAKLAVTS
jgi:leucine efflux protein